MELSNNQLYKISAHGAPNNHQHVRMLITEEVGTTLSDEITSCVIDMGSVQDYQSDTLSDAQKVYRSYMDSVDHPDIASISMSSLIKIVADTAYQEKVKEFSGLPSIYDTEDLQLSVPGYMIDNIKANAEARLCLEAIEHICGEIPAINFMQSIMVQAATQYHISYPFGNNN